MINLGSQIGWQRFGPSGDLGQKKFRDLGQISQKLASFGQRFGPNYQTSLKCSYLYIILEILISLHISNIYTIIKTYFSKTNTL